MNIHSLHSTDSCVHFDMAAIGIGPFHLSLAAALAPIRNISTAFFDRSPQMQWHDGLRLPGAVMQTSYLKDLITPICPTSPYTFINYLVQNQKFYDFVAGRFDTIDRAEFIDYMAWVARQLPSLRFGCNIQCIERHQNGFRLYDTHNNKYSANALSVGVGLSPRIPQSAKPFLGDTCFHAAYFMQKNPKLAGKKVAIIGGGQTGAEIFLTTINSTHPPNETIWVDRRPHISPLEEGAFVDQIFSPSYVSFYQNLDFAAREKLYSGQKNAANGLTPETLEAIYKALYREKHISGGSKRSVIYSGVSLENINRHLNGRYDLSLFDMHRGVYKAVSADIVILATGWQRQFPACLNPVQSELDLDVQGNLQLDSTFRVRWSRENSPSIFAFNQGARSHGIADAQLSLAAWRSGVVVNELTNSNFYPTAEISEIISWGLQANCRTYDQHSKSSLKFS